MFELPVLILLLALLGLVTAKGSEGSAGRKGAFIGRHITPTPIPSTRRCGRAVTRLVPDWRIVAAIFGKKPGIDNQRHESTKFPR